MNKPDNNKLQGTRITPKDSSETGAHTEVITNCDQSVLMSIENRILTIREHQVMVDRDLAELYQIETKVLNQAVKRNIERFPESFRFQLSNNEKDELVTICDRFKVLKHSTSNPYTFTEQGVAMLSDVLKSKTAIHTSIRIIEAFSNRIEKHLTTKRKITNEYEVIDLETNEITKETETREVDGHLWENISTMVAIAVEIAANNVRVASNALKVASQMLADMRDKDADKRKRIIGLIYNKLRHIPNSAFLQVWLQNITHVTDDWTQGELYDMPLCKVVAKQPVTLWNNSWLKPEFADILLTTSIADREALAKAGPVITFKAKRQYDEMEY